MRCTRWGISKPVASLSRNGITDTQKIAISKTNRFGIEGVLERDLRTWLLNDRYRVHLKYVKARFHLS